MMNIVTLSRRLCKAAILLLVLAWLPDAVPGHPWRFYAFNNGTFHELALLSPATFDFKLDPFPERLVPPAWQVTASALSDVTGDGRPEWALVVWRPWRDWPIQRWNSGPSPIVNFRDAAGDSCHLILLDPDDGREIWAGSALPAPLLALAAGDVDGDGLNELVTLEGDYATGRGGPAFRVNVWGWNGFGFTLQWRSPPGVFNRLHLTDVNSDCILDIAVW